MKRPTDKRGELMLKIQASDFAAHEAALYLDNHPYCKKALAAHARAIKAYDEYKAEYERSYGPLTNRSINEKSWNWVKGAWPWQTEEDYVDLR